MLIKKPNLISQYQWSRSIAGLEGVHVLKFQGWAAIETVVFRKGRVAVHGELWGQKRFSFKPPLVAPSIVQLCRGTTQGHIGARPKSQGAHPLLRISKALKVPNLAPSPCKVLCIPELMNG
jgi:hypothetical protein